MTDVDKQSDFNLSLTYVVVSLSSQVPAWFQEDASIVVDPLFSALLEVNVDVVVDNDGDVPFEAIVDGVTAFGVISPISLLSSVGSCLLK